MKHPDNVQTETFVPIHWFQGGVKSLNSSELQFLKDFSVVVNALHLQYGIFFVMRTLLISFVTFPVFTVPKSHAKRITYYRLQKLEADLFVVMLKCVHEID